MKKFSLLFYSITGVLLISMFSQNCGADEQPLAGNKTVSKKLRLGDRFYIQAVLNEIFGPDSAPITEKFIFRQASSFGGPCDVYEQVRIGVNADSLTDPHSFCPGGNTAANLPIVGVSNMLRQGYVLKACKLLTAESKTLNFALSQIFLKAEVSAPNPKNVLAAFQLFNPEKHPGESVIGALSKIGAQKSKVKKRWALILYTLCTDPAWQVI